VFTERYELNLQREFRLILIFKPLGGGGGGKRAEQKGFFFGEGGPGGGFFWDLGFFSG